MDIVIIGAIVVLIVLVEYILRRIIDKYVIEEDKKHEDAVRAGLYLVICVVLTRMAVSDIMVKTEIQEIYGSVFVWSSILVLTNMIGARVVGFKRSKYWVLALSSVLVDCIILGILCGWKIV